MRDVLEGLGIQRAPVTWFDNAVKIGRKRVLALGFCGYGGGVAFIAVYNPNEPITQEWLKLIAVKDVLYGKWKGEDGCDDSQWCLNLKCPYNRAELKHFKKYGVQSVEDLKRLHGFLEECAGKLGLESQGSVVLSFEKPPLKLKRVKR
ncbi:MAG: hypothetical protein QXG76_05790 [Candidatus Bathyarchaeia archaeon]